MEVAGRREGEEQENRGNERECEACKGDGVTTQADGVCFECEELMCKICFKHHLKAKQCRNHVFDSTFPKKVPVKRDFEVDKCKRHAGELIKFYCQKHETVGCGECMIPYHSGCSLENIKDLCKELRNSEEFAGPERNITVLECLSNENGTDIKENKNANAEMYEKTLYDIRQFRKDINKYLDTAEKNILQEAKEISDANDNNLTKLEKVCMLQSSLIADVSGHLDPNLYSESCLFIQTVQLKSHIRALNQAVSKLQQENNIKEFYFVPDTQLQSLTKSLHNFGKIYCSHPLSRVSKEETTKLTEKSPNTQAEDKAGLDAADAVNKIRECCGVPKIVVGSRVRLRNIGLLIGEGTVTHIGPNDTVTVKWFWATFAREHKLKDIQLI